MEYIIMSRYRQTMTELLKQVRESKQKPYVSMSSGGQYNVLDKDGKTAYSTKDQRLAQDYFKKNYDKLKENEELEVNEKTYGWTLVSKAKDLAKKFANNITKAVAEIEKLEKGLSKNPAVDTELRKYNEENSKELQKDKTDNYKDKNKELEEKYTVVITKKDGSTMELGRYNTPAEAQRYVDMYGKGAKVKKEEVKIEEGKMSDIDALVKDGKSSEEIAKLMKLPIKTVKDILGEEKEVPKGYHKMPDGTIMKDSEHKKEETEKDSKEDSAKEIAALKDQINILKTKLENEKHRAVKPEPNPKTGEVPLTIGIAAAEFKKNKEKEEVKEENLQELSKAERDKRIQRAKDMIKYYDAQKKAALKGPNKALAKKMLKNETELEEVTQKEIDKFHTDLDSLVHKTFGHSSKEKMDEKVADSIIKDLQKAYAPMKGKTISPEMANKISKHLNQPSYDLNVLRQLKKANIPFISTIARNKIYKKTGKFEDRRLYVEGIAGLQKKADKSGMPYNILKQVYDRGMAAWKSGHRPGASQQQWAFARVNSFITKSSGTWGGADKDLAAKVKGSK